MRFKNGYKLIYVKDVEEIKDGKSITVRKAFASKSEYPTDIDGELTYGDAQDILEKGFKLIYEDRKDEKLKVSSDLLPSDDDISLPIYCNGEEVLGTGPDDEDKTDDYEYASVEPADKTSKK